MIYLHPPHLITSVKENEFHYSTICCLSELSAKFWQPPTSALKYFHSVPSHLFPWTVEEVVTINYHLLYIEICVVSPSWTDQASIILSKCLQPSCIYIIISRCSSIQTMKYSDSDIKLYLACTLTLQWEILTDKHMLDLT